MISSEQFQAIADLDLEPIKVKLMHQESGEGWSLDQVNAVEFEYRRFLYLMKTFPNEQTAPLMDVDTFWHYHILDTMKYAADCEAVFGYFLHHFPYIGLRGEDDEAAHIRVGDRMRELYEATFGEAYVREAATAYSGAAVEATAYSGAATKTAYSGAATAQTAYSGAAVQTAYSGAATAKTASSGAATAKTAYSGAATAKTAYSGAAVQTAYSGAATARTAYSGAATAAKTAYSGAATSTKTAYSGAATSTKTAYSGAATSAKTAYSGAATSAKTAYSGAANEVTAYSGAAAQTAYSGAAVAAAPQQENFYVARPRLNAA